MRRVTTVLSPRLHSRKKAARRCWSCTNSIPRKKLSMPTPVWRTGCPRRSRNWTSFSSSWARASTVCEVCALSDLDNISVRIADVAARLAVLGDRLRDELRSSTLPQVIAGLNIRDAEIHKAVDVIRVGDAERYRRFI